MKLRDITEQHHYPGWLVRSPRWIHLHYFLLRIFFLRSRVCRRKIRQILQRDNRKPGRILDAGCGEGQFIVPIAAQFPKMEFTGVDILEDHIAFLRVLKRVQQLNNCAFVQDSLEEHLEEHNAYSLIYIIGVLQYTKHPAHLIHLAHRSQTAGDYLMIYTPVTGGIEFGFYRYFQRRYGHYDDARSYHQAIDASQLRSWIQKSGYRIVEEEKHYRAMGALGHQIMQSLLMMITYWRGLTKLIPGLFFIILMPIFVPLQLVDRWTKSISGDRSNGLLLILQK